MAPATRSTKSAPNTPQKAIGSPSGQRKSPHCSTCHRPRRGHPRQGCPSAETDAKDGSAPDIIDAISSIRLDCTAQETHSAPLPHRVKVNVVEGSIAEMDVIKVDESEGPLAKADIRRIQGRLMPGTLIPPGDSFYDLEPSSTQKTQVADVQNDALAALNHDSQSPTTSTSTRPVLRSASVNAREDFLDDLDRLSTRAPVSVYSVPLDDLPTLERSARKVGFRTATLVPELETKETNNALLIVGVDGEAVERLRSQCLAHQSLQDRHGRPNRMGALKNVAGGAFAGAALLYTGLVYTPDFA